MKPCVARPSSIRGHPNTDPTIQPLGLNDDDKAALIAFLGALTDADFLQDPAFGDPALNLLYELDAKR